MNHQPFEGDDMIGWAIKGLIDRWMPSAIIETGTEYGHTAVAMRKWGLPVFTIEKDERLFLKCYPWLLGEGVIPICALSPQVLPELCRSYLRVLCFLDAHTMHGSYVREELAVMTNCLHPPVIVVHDVKVPDAPDLGYDIYANGTELTFEYFSDLLPAIYPDGYEHRFNKEAYGARRGCCFITPKE